MQGGQEGGQGLGSCRVVDGHQVGQGDVSAGGQRHVLGDGALQLGGHPLGYVGDLVRVHQHAAPHLRQPHARIETISSKENALGICVIHYIDLQALMTKEETAT